MTAIETLSKESSQALITYYSAQRGELEIVDRRHSLGLPIEDAPDWPYFWKPDVFQMTMGLTKLELNNWLTFDFRWETEHRQQLEWTYGEMRDEVLQVLPGADDSCEELPQVVVAYDPLWKEMIQKSTEKFFFNLKVGSSIQRYNGFIPFPARDVHQQAATIDAVFIRSELQSLCHLPRTGDLIFTVRTHLNPVASLEDDPEALDMLWDATRNFSEKASIYKVKHMWNHVFEPFCQEVPG
ncbi:alpha-1,2-mannosyltransferase [Fusarium agapanthi]|uniref:Alpha-1,2-mannosyltransferase n=1 Tax=Fusarium agapanthi TaxID=1803897 RepID=A0A9P5B1X0_9HYPO|nr:alpha-1,2-mannosyltransferase [Fusarium agapanthi]